MSSAILYVAIVAIWACVLIPRWLRRTPSVPVAEFPEPAEPDVPPLDVTEPVADEAPAESYAEGPADVPLEPAYPGEFDDFDGSGGSDGFDGFDGEDGDEDRGPERPPLTREESRRRMLAARRRLLMLLMGLETVACALPALGLAALWVVIPPSVMLAGYTLLLREASKADREQAQHEADAAQARARARERERSRSSASGSGSSADRSAARPQAPVQPQAPATPRPEEYEDLGHGRDYAPGLAGKYTASNTEEVIDLTEYKRAVGD